MLSATSSLSLAAAGLYVVVALACVVAWHCAGTPGGKRWHRTAWIAIALLFAGLAIYRYVGLEEWIRDMLRDWLRAQGSYAERRSFQRPIAGVLIMLVVTGAAYFGFLAVRSIRERGLLYGRRALPAFVGLAAAGTMLVLVLFRLLSLSPIDTLLYGPLKLNWITDIGSSLVIAIAAIAYCVRLRSPR